MTVYPFVKRWSCFNSGAAATTPGHGWGGVVAQPIVAAPFKKLSYPLSIPLYDGWFMRT
jgi:hypothetical protein